MSRLRHTANSAILVTLFSHVFCCGLPILVNFLALIAGIGALSAMVPWVNAVHETLHQFEPVLLGFSAVALGFGFFVHFVVARQNCAAHNCSHEPCAPKTKQSKRILSIATILFLFNSAGYIWHQMA